MNKTIEVDSNEESNASCTTTEEGPCNPGVTEGGDDADVYECLQEQQETDWPVSSQLRRIKFWCHSHVVPFLQAKKPQVPQGRDGHTADIRTVFTVETCTIPDGTTEKGHWCKVCKCVTHVYCAMCCDICQELVLLQKYFQSGFPIKGVLKDHCQSCMLGRGPKRFPSYSIHWTWTQEALRNLQHNGQHMCICHCHGCMPSSCISHVLQLSQMAAHLHEPSHQPNAEAWAHLLALGIAIGTASGGLD